MHDLAVSNEDLKGDDDGYYLGGGDEGKGRCILGMTVPHYSDSNAYVSMLSSSSVPDFDDFHFRCYGRYGRVLHACANEGRVIMMRMVARHDCMRSGYYSNSSHLNVLN